MTGGGGSRGKEINIETDVLKDCNGKLIKLEGVWRNVIKDEEPFQKSTSDAKLKLEEVMVEMKNCSNEFSQVISNTITLFEDMGMSFQETDKRAAQSIRTTKM